MDIIEEISLPSCGLVYDNEIKWNNRLRAPRLCDKGIGDMTRRNKLQAGILDKTLLEPLGISAYDLHTADFLYLNLMQRQMSKGNKPYKIKIKCSKCGYENVFDFDLATLSIDRLKEKPVYEYTGLDEKVYTLNFITPRILDDAREQADLFKERYPDNDQDVYTQELLRLLIKEVDGRDYTYSQMTGIINNLYLEDVNGIIVEASKADFGVNLRQETTCQSCGKIIPYNLPV